jgi:hypothetical protein
MKVVALLLACVVSNAMWGVAFACIAHKAEARRAEVRHADYQNCFTEHGPPLFQRRHENGRPPLADLA